MQRSCMPIEKIMLIMASLVMTNESWDINELNITAIRQQKKVIAQEKLFHLTFMYRSLQESE